MLARRAFLAVLAGLPLVAHADSGAPRWHLGETVEKAGKGTITAKRFGSRTVFARLGTAIKPASIDLTSHNNANTEFTMWVTFGKQPDKDLFVFADGEWFQSDSYGHDSTGSQASFVFDRATAERLAKVFKLTLNERAKLDDGLVATWSMPPQASTRTTDALPIKLRVKNTSKKAIGFVIGGRQRGARDNRFSFKITRNGQPVAIKEAPDFGGIMYYKKLEPGDEQELSVDLRSWADLSTPGHYAIDATYEGELAKDGVMPSTAAERKNLWDLTLTGQGGILVQ